MKRRLYFLLPDLEHATTTIGDLKTKGIPETDLHLLGGDTSTTDAPTTTTTLDRACLPGRVERLVWGLNLLIFGIAAVALLLLLLQTAWAWTPVPLAIMALTFFGGLRFTHVPDVQVDEFRDALHHGEVLLMLDVPPEQVAEAERLVTRRHPEAVPGGVSWQSDLLAL